MQNTNQAAVTGGQSARVPRPIGALRNTIAGAWNLDFTTRRRYNVKRLMRDRLRCSPKGKGNKAWKRVAAMEKHFRATGGFYVSDLI